MDKYSVVCYSATKTSKFLPYEKYSLYGVKTEFIAINSTNASL